MAVTAKTKLVTQYPGKSKFFFMNDRLYALIDKDPVGDKIMAYDFEEHNKKIFRLSDYKRHAERAYRLPEVCEMIGRSYSYGRKIILEDLPWLGTVASYDPNWRDHPKEAWHWYLFSKQDVLDAHEHFANIDPRGDRIHPKRPGRRNYPKPRNKLVKRNDMPTREELLAQLNSNEVYYVRNEDGEFEPVFKPNWE